MNIPVEGRFEHRLTEFVVPRSRIPIIMGVRGQAQDIVLTGKGGVAMTPDDPASLLSCIDAVRANRNEFCLGREYVACHFDRTALADRMLATLLHFGPPQETPLPSAAPEVRRAA